MAVLTRETVQGLAVLRAVSQWKNGAYGPLRIHKTLFFADKANEADWRLFTFKKWHLGQYSDTISETLNCLQTARRIRSSFDGPSQRILAAIKPEMKTRIARFFNRYFPDWSKGFRAAFNKWAYMSNDAIIVKAHDDPTYTKSKHGKTIFKSALPKHIAFSELPNADAEELSDLVNDKLHTVLRDRLNSAVEQPIKDEDWRSIYFADVMDSN